MCFPYDAEPPIARLAGGSVEHTDLTLEAEDGNVFSAFLAEGDGSREASVVVLPDVRGLFRFYEARGSVNVRWSAVRCGCSGGLSSKVESRSTGIHTRILFWWLQLLASGS